VTAVVEDLDRLPLEDVHTIVCGWTPSRLDRTLA
jgi:hypothetical protein